MYLSFGQLQGGRLKFASKHQFAKPRLTAKAGKDVLMIAMQREEEQHPSSEGEAI